MSQPNTGTMTGRERLLAAYARRPVDRIPCSPRVWAWMREHYGDVELETLLRMAAEFDFDPHAAVGVHSHVTALTTKAPSGDRGRAQEWATIEHGPAGLRPGDLSIRVVS